MGGKAWKESTILHIAAGFEALRMQNNSNVLFETGREVKKKKKKKQTKPKQETNQSLVSLPWMG